MNGPSLSAILIASLLLPRAATADNAVGQLRGSVRDESGGPLTSATIEVLDTRLGTLTDPDGRYRLQRLPPGKYILQASHLGYQPARREVEIQAGQALVVDFTLQSTLYLLDEVAVIGEITSGQARALNAQNAALNLKHVASHELFSRFPDRNAAESLQRLPGVALDRDQGEGEYVQVRGLNAQLNSVTVNGRRIPSPTANLNEGRAVGLDLLQLNSAEFVEIVKALTPDMDGDALGGAVNMVLKRPPAEPEYSLNLAGGWNDKAARFSEWSSEIVEVSGTAGGRLLGERLGLIGGGSLYRTGRGPLLDQVGYASADSAGLEYHLWDNYDVRRHRLGLLAGADYRVSDSHDLRLNYTYNRFLDDEIRRRRQFNTGLLSEEMEVRNRREDQQYSMVEAAGQQCLAGLVLEYALSLAQASEELPDRTYFLFSRGNPYRDAEGKPLDMAALLGLDLETPFPRLDPFRLFRNRFDNQKFTENDLTGQVDAEFFYGFRGRQSSVKAGLKVGKKEKKARARRWEYLPGNEAMTTGENEFVFVDVRYDDQRAISLFPLERYRAVQQLLNYDAEETVYAAYAMTTLNWTPQFSSLVGVRGETTRHAYSHLSSFVESDESYANVLPSLHLTYRLAGRTNLRLALTSGLARPEYSRLLPIVTPPDDGQILKGNPALVASKSFGVDVLLESFAGPLGLLSAGAFAKRILDPVVVRAYQQNLFKVLEPVNGEAGYIWGVEFSLMQQLTILDLALLRHAGMYATYTYSGAEMDYGSERADNGPLPGHARHVANLGLFYDHALAGRAFTLSFNYRAPMLKNIETEPRNDVWFDDEVHLDLSGRQRLSDHLDLFLKLNNLTDQKEREVLGNPYRKGGGTRWRETEVYGPSGVLGLSYAF